jgi:putative PIN family toxin of toxin-antitoxin system
MTAAVFDCMVFLQAATNDRGPAFACLSLVESGHVALHVSPTILAEVRDVLTRPRIQAKFPHLTVVRVDILLQKIATLATVVDDVPECGLAIRDPDDLPYLNLAISENVDCIVSRDKDLLDLMNDPSFVGKYPHLRIVDPVEFLAETRPTTIP